MKKRLLMRCLLGFALVVLVTTPVLAQIYYAVLTVQETFGNDYDMLAHVTANATQTVDVTHLANAGFITSTGLDTRVTVGGTNLPHMLSDSDILFAKPTANMSAEQVWLTMGNSALDSFYIVVGYGGTVAIADNSELELGDRFDVLQSGWADTSAGSDKNLAIKTDAFRLYVSTEGIVTAVVDPDGDNVSVSANATSGEHIFKVSANTTHLHLWVDGTLEDTVALGGASVPDNGNGWTLMQNNVMPYMEYFKIWVGS